MNQPEFPDDGMEPGRDVSGDPFAVMMDRIEQAADDYLMAASSATSQDVIRAFLMFSTRWIASTYQIDERDTWLTINTTMLDHVKLHRGDL